MLFNHIPLMLMPTTAADRIRQSMCIKVNPYVPKNARRAGVLLQPTRPEDDPRDPCTHCRDTFVQAYSSTHVLTL